MAELHIFDFDGTLFRSPDKPDWWDFSWYLSEASLGRPCVPDKPGADWWISKTVNEAKKSISDPKVFTVLMTGRTNNTALGYRIPELLKQAGLSFDKVMLNPGGNTASWKAQAVGKLLKQHPGTVQLWEDNQDNIKAIKAVVEKADHTFVSHLVKSPDKKPECKREDVEQLINEGWLDAKVRKNLTSKVADRYLVRLAARKAHTSLQKSRRTASSEITPEVLAAFAEAFYLQRYRGRVAFGGLLKKLKQLGQVFTKVPKLWDHFKKMVGITSLTELPKALKELAKRGYQVLRKLVGKLFSTWPLKIYTLSKDQFFSINNLLGNLMAKFPAFGKWVNTKVRPRVDQFDQWLRSKSPALSGVLMAAVYIWIWFNVVEFEWDLKGLADAFTGALSLSDLLSSLPGSALGFLMRALNLGTFTLLPAAFAARLLWLMSKRYVVWTGRGFELNRELLAADLKVAPEIANQAYFVSKFQLFRWW